MATNQSHKSRSYESAPSTTVVDESESPRVVDAVVVGAGFSGMYMLYRLRKLGLATQVFEAASDVGGTWWWNRYPGARCDIESFDYSYSFDPDLQQEWDWSERYAAQPEILRYAQHVADRHDLRRDIQFDTRVLSATWQPADNRWLVVTDRGDRLTARYCIMAVGCLSAAKEPEIDGLDTFAGRTYHTGKWPHEGVDFTGLRVGVIGTGSSGIQCIPLIAEQADELVVYQRTPNYAQPAMNAPIDQQQAAEMKANYPEHRERTRRSRGGVLVPASTSSALEADPQEREKLYQERWESGTLFGLLSAYNDLMVDPDANATAAEFVHDRIREIVKDPEVAAKLTPRGYPFGAKRVCLDTGYYATFNRENVHLVDLRETPIEAIVPEGVRTSGEVHELDVLVFATGFDAMTGPLLGPDIIGRDGISLRDKWAAGPTTYLGIATAGFPNLFTITGPGSPSVLTNMLVSIEQHVEWIADYLAHAQSTDVVTIEAEQAAEDDWTAHVNQVASFTLYPQANSWYMGANVPGKPRVFMPYLGGVDGYRTICDDVAANGYRGFRLVRAADISTPRQA